MQRFCHGFCCRVSRALGAISKPTRAGELPQEGNGVGPGAGGRFSGGRGGAGVYYFACKKSLHGPGPHAPCRMCFWPRPRSGPCKIRIKRPAARYVSEMGSMPFVVVISLLRFKNANSRRKASTVRYFQCLHSNGRSRGRRLPPHSHGLAARRSTTEKDDELQTSLAIA